MVPRQRLVERVNKFISGEWSLLVEESLIVAASGRSLEPSKEEDDNSPMTLNAARNRAWSMVQMGRTFRREARQLWSHLGLNERWTCCRDTSRRPRQPRAAVPGHIAQLQPDNLLDLDQFQVQGMYPLSSKRSRRRTSRHDR